MTGSDRFELLESCLDPGTILIEASAGTGKTYCLTGIVLRLLLEGRVSGIDRILAVTFTNAATDELKERIRSAISKASAVAEGGEAEDVFVDKLVRRTLPECRGVLRAARTAVDDLAVHTLHGFCNRLIEEHAFETAVPFDLDLIEDEQALLREAAREFYRETFYGDAFAARIAASLEWTPERLLDDTRDVRGRFNLRVEPEAQPLREARDRLFDEYQRLRAHFDRSELETYLAPERLYKERTSSLLGSGNVSETLEEAEAFLQGRGFMRESVWSRLTSERLARSFKKNKRADGPAPPFLDACERWHAEVARFRRAVYVAFLDALQRKSERLKRERGVFAYNDLLLYVWGALCDPTRAEGLRDAVRRRYDAVLIDEFQDTDALQWGIFDGLFRGTSLFLIGDPKQSIYRFRGADVFAYLDAAKKADRRYSLDRNWRSARGLVAAVNALFENCPVPFVWEEIDYPHVEAAGLVDQQPLRGDGGRPIEWLWAGCESNRERMTDSVVRGVARKIVELLQSGLRIGDDPLGAASIAVLVRTNGQARQVQQGLRALGVPAVVSASDSVFASEESLELARVLGAVVQPANSARVRAALATRVCGLKAADIARLGEEDNADETYLARFDEYLRCWRGEGFAAMVARLLSDFEVKERFLRLPEGPRRLTDLLHLIELVEHTVANDELSPTEAVAWLLHHRALAEREKSTDTERRLEAEGGAVRVVTTHKSKGLEYDVVFCPFLWEPAPKAQDSPVVVHEGTNLIADFGSDRLGERRLLRVAEDLAEQMRLAYVALTRAKYRCYIVVAVGGSNRYGEAALPHLLLQGGGPSAEESAAQRAARRVAEIESRLQSDPSVLRRAVEALVASHGDAMSLADLPAPEDGDERLPIPKKPRTLRAREFPEGARSRLVPWRIVSFSSMIRRLDGEEPDHADPASMADEPSAASGVFALARGPRTGHCLHEILERIDFTGCGDERTTAIVRDALLRHGLDGADAHAARIEPQEVVRGLIETLVAAPAPVDGVRLCDVPRSKRLNEWRFFLPTGCVTTQDVTAVLTDCAESRIAEEYASRIEFLRRDRLDGFLTGFVDLVFEHDGRWYVVDWKSNYLGGHAQNYGDASLWRAMCDHHYVLQYHLYTLAVHRFLRARIPGYRYESHFGAVYYVFLRGVPDGAGWYRDRPSARLIESLDRLFASGRGA